MPLKLMYITNNPKIATIAENAGVDRIFLDMEYIGKDARQGGMNTVQNHHTVADVISIKKVLKKAELLVRVNPIHDYSPDYCSSKEEIDSVIKSGADIVMLPFFKTIDEVKLFLSIVGGRCKTMLLVETPEAVNNIDEILCLHGIDYIHIGINDLSLGMGKQFMFELLADGTVEVLCSKFKKAGIPYGFGGIASLGQGALPSENVIKEHYRLESTCAILSRSFCDVNRIVDLDKIKNIFKNGIGSIRAFEKECEIYSTFFKENENEIKKIVRNVIGD